LIEELEAIVDRARPVPLTDQVRVDQDALAEVVDQLRDLVPVEWKRARFLVRERERLLAEARREAERLYAHARDEAAAITSEREITRLAERQADEILARARWRAERQLLKVDDWSDEILASLERNLESFQQAIIHGRQRLHERTHENVIDINQPGDDLRAA
jgi:vacuolar-type H+-ATPase subunit H